MVKKLRVALISTLVFLMVFSAGMLVGQNFKAKAEELEPILTNYAKNLSFDDNVHIMYAIETENVKETDEIGMLVWTNAPEEYIYGTQETVLTPTIRTVDGSEKPMHVFAYPISAKQMTETIYTVAYAKRGGSYYYSEARRYSALEYAYNKLGKTEVEETTDEELKDLLDAMLVYGGAAQKYFNYNLDDLASDAYSYVKIANASFSDGYNYTIAKVGTKVEIFINEGYELAETYAEYIIVEEDKVFVTIPEQKTIDNLSIVSSNESIDEDALWDLMCENLLSQSYLGGNGNYVLNIYDGEVQITIIVDGDTYYDNMVEFGSERFILPNGENYTFYTRAEGEQGWSITTENRNKVEMSLTAELSLFGLIFSDYPYQVTYNYEESAFETQIDYNMEIVPLKIIVEQNRLAKAYVNGELYLEVEYDNAKLIGPIDEDLLWETMCENLENQSFDSGNANYHLKAFPQDTMHNDTTHIMIDGNIFCLYVTNGENTSEKQYIVAENGEYPELSAELSHFALEFRTYNYPKTYNYAKGVLEMQMENWGVLSIVEFVIVDTQLTKLYLDGKLLYEIEYNNVVLEVPVVPQS